MNYILSVLTLKHGYHLVLVRILVGVWMVGDLIISHLSSPTAYNTCLKYLEMVSIDLLKVFCTIMNLSL